LEVRVRPVDSVPRAVECLARRALPRLRHVWIVAPFCTGSTSACSGLQNVRIRSLKRRDALARPWRRL